MRFMSVEDMEQYLAPCVQTEGGVKVLNKAKLRGEPIDRLAYNAVFHEDQEQRGVTRALIREIAAQTGAVPASIQGLYEAMGRGEVSGFTVPAVNIRGMTYDVARALFRAAMKNHATSFIFEIAKSEMGYTKQEPAEYAVVLLAAAVKEGYEGPVFIQGDHFQFNAKNFKADPAKEADGIKKLIKKAVEAGFYNIDIDSSTLVDLDQPDTASQQRHNYEQAAAMTQYIRGIEPQGITVSVGGEIGEVGGHNSTVEELKAYMDGYLKTLPKGMKGISKISVQTGTSHGGVVLPDGTVAKVKLDFETLEKISKAARSDYKMSGAVQHGASTLPDDAFDHFPKCTASEVHLATGFQNMTFDHPAFPKDLTKKMHEWLHKECASEKKAGETEEQFIYKTRKKGYGFLKKDVWTMPEDARNAVAKSLEDKFDFLFKKLNVVNTKPHVDKHVKPVALKPDLKAEIAAAAEPGKPAEKDDNPRAD
ncbi:MAG: class II fructose-bisphosphate aldolase [Nitrospinae bacterium]|nr:class II fructose-bisphosphate aldolase [Nitrospinota bacterium]